jgi:hypothetical protein
MYTCFAKMMRIFRKPLKRLLFLAYFSLNTGIKPGVNENPILKISGFNRYKISSI